MQQKKQRKHRYAASIGGAFVVLALIGVITVIVASLQLTGRVLDNTNEKVMFEDIIRPVLMFDPVPFESPQDVDMNSLLLYAMWGTLTSERAKNYTYSDTQELMIPASDLDVAAARLFGSELKLEHQTFSDYETTYVYNAETHIYGVRVTTQLYVYTPDVREIVKEGEYYRLDVYYNPPGNAWNMTFAGDRSTGTIEKHMYYYMLKNKDSYQLVKIQDVPNEPIVS
ncbi:MAG: hypothetical protein LBV27_06905 [Oscillospiraceae bacterium]|jgi:hypothetical protein|nr:hypothetical protein [Oscillospiraceae bacterium]